MTRDNVSTDQGSVLSSVRMVTTAALSGSLEATGTKFCTKVSKNTVHENSHTKEMDISHIGLYGDW